MKIRVSFRPHNSSANKQHVWKLSAVCSLHVALDLGATTNSHLKYVTENLLANNNITMLRFTIRSFSFKHREISYHRVVTHWLDVTWNTLCSYCVLTT